MGHQQEVLELVDQQRKRLGLTVLSAFHDLTLASQYGTSMALLVNGKVTKSGLPHEILTEATLKTFMEQMFQCIMTEIDQYRSQTWKPFGGEFK